MSIAIPKFYRSRRPSASIATAPTAAAYEDLRKRLWAIKDAVDAAERVEEVAAIDETAGWP